MVNQDLLYDHYKDSFEQQKGFLKKRNLYTYGLLGFIVLFSFQFQERGTTEKIISHVLSEYIGGVRIQFAYICFIINIAYLLVLMSYYQINLNIERLYSYIHKIEDALSKDGFKIEREGLNYLRSYPWMLSWVHRIYQWGLPVGIIFVSVVQIGIYYKGEFSWYSVVNMMIFAFAIMLSMLYLSYIHFHEEYFDKKQYANLSLCERLCHYFKGNKNKSERIIR